MRIILAAAVILLILAGCGTSTPPTSYEAPDAPSTLLTSDEQHSLDYIAAHIPELEALYDQVSDTASNWTPGDNSDINACIDTWGELKADWESFPPTLGQVESLEYSYEAAGNSVRALVVMLSDIAQGNLPSDARMHQLITTSLDDIQSCKDELAAVEGGSY